MRSICGSGSKEMLEVAGKPLIDHSIAEALETEVEKIVVVSSTSKPDLNKHLAEVWQSVRVVFQPEPTGLAPAVFLAGLRKAAVVLLPDALFYPSSPTERIVRALAEGYDIVLPTQQVSDSEVTKFGILDEDVSPPRLLEKPNPADTGSRSSIGGRFGFSSTALQVMAVEMFENPQKDLPLSPLISSALKMGLSYKELPLTESELRFDCGSVRGFRQAQKVLGL